MLKAIILAAGRGKRLNALTTSNHKALLKVGENSILERQILILQKLGINDIILITGYQHSKVQEKLAQYNIKFIHNPNYYDSDTLFSLWCARDYFDNGFICIYGDLIFDEKILSKLLAVNNSEICLVVDKSKTILDSHTVYENNNIVQGFGNDLKSKANGQYIGIALYSKTGSQILKKTLETFSQDGNMNGEIIKALKKIIVEHNCVYCVFTNDLQWFNINKKDDLEKAKKFFST